MGWKGKTAKVLLKTAKVVSAAAVVYGLQQSVAFGLQELECKKPAQAAFRERTGIELCGLEISDSSLENLAIQLRREQDQPMMLERIVVIHNNPLLQTEPEQHHFTMKGIFGRKSYGMHMGRTIYLLRTDQGAFGHELQHAIAKYIVTNNPGFAPAWRALSTDENGKTLYRSYVPLTGSNGERFFEQGFVSNEATDLDEDMATFRLAAQSRPRLFWSFLHNPGHTLIRKKVELSIRYGFLPKEYREYIEIASQQPDSPGLAEAAAIFLRKHPQSDYIESIEHLISEQRSLKR